jgi:hypothetical protein
MPGMEGPSALGKPPQMNKLDQFLATQAGQHTALGILLSGGDLVAAGATAGLNLSADDIKHFRADWLHKEALDGYWPQIDGDVILDRIRLAYRDAIQYALDHGTEANPVRVNTTWVCADDLGSAWFQVSWSVDGDVDHPTSVTVTYMTPRPNHPGGGIYPPGQENAFWYDADGNMRRAGTDFDVPPEPRPGG